MRDATDRSKDGVLTGHANDKCPGCGAKRKANPFHKGMTAFDCGSYHTPDSDGIVVDYRCLRLQLAAKHALLVKSDRDFLESQEANSVLAAQRDQLESIIAGAARNYDRDWVAVRAKLCRAVAACRAVVDGTMETRQYWAGLCVAVVAEADAAKKETQP